MALDIVLTESEVRVLGSLIEKEITTPEYYPLSLNALKNACNQTSNRDPVVTFDEITVADAVEQLKQKKLVSQDNLGRVPKFEETFLKNTRLMRPEAAVLCVLMLRGPQTSAEIRGRTERLHPFGTADDVAATLQTLQEWGYITLLPRQTGKKEPRFAHLLAGLPTPSTRPEEEKEEEKPAIARSVISDFLTEHAAFKTLQTEVHQLQQELHDLKQAFLDFKSQF